MGSTTITYLVGFRGRVFGGRVVVEGVRWARRGQHGWRSNNWIFLKRHFLRR